jgi:outer membrane protein OmpA-like peptidoglycan-associated protein
MPTTPWRALVTVPLILLTAGALHAQRNVARTDDHPLLRRASGAQLTHREVKADHTCDLPTGAVHGSRFSRTAEFRGRTTSVTYTLKQGRSVGDVYRELADQLRDAGLEPLFECKDGKCGSGTGPANFCTPAWRGANGQRQLTGTVQRPGGSAIVSLHVQAPENRERAVAHIIVMEVGTPTWTGIGAGIRPGTQALTTFSAATLLTKGKVDLAEPLFQPKSATLRTEADPVLADIAQFLKQNPSLNVIVANSSRTGDGWMADQILSRNRALALDAALTSRHGVAANRVKAQANGGGNMENVRGDSQTQLLLDK